jgi:hypothetical protein
MGNDSCDGVVVVCQLSRALTQVTLYWERYSARLGGKTTTSA